MPATFISGVLDAFAVRDPGATLAVIGVELGLLAVAVGGFYFFARWAIARLGMLKLRSSPASVRALQVRLRNVYLALCIASAIAILGYNGWLIARHVDVPSHTIALLRGIGRDVWIGLAIAAGKLAGAALGIVVASRVIRRISRVAEARISRWDQLRDKDRSLAVRIAGLNRALVATGWMLLALYALRLFGLPGVLPTGLLMIIRAYIVIAVGLLIIRSSVVIVDTIDGLSQKYAATRGWSGYYDQLRPLVPTFRACLEYASWVALASLVLLQLGPMGTLAVWGPKLLQVIGIFFLSRVVIELGCFEIGRRLLPAEGLDETARRRRATMAPLIRSSYTYAVYFGAAVLSLASLGFNPMPFLAGAGILGLVVGFGAQSLINDVVSGFFILFENTYLVGDVIEAGGGKGVVEAIEFRTTKIRDVDGRVHVVRNGDVKDVINYSKEYTLAVVPVDIVYDADLRGVFSVLREAGERLRAENPDVLAQTEIDGITAFGATTMTVRTSTRVKPGRHEAAAAALRFWIKEAFDRRAGSAVRRGIVPADLVEASAPDPRDRRPVDDGGSRSVRERRPEPQG